MDEHDDYSRRPGWSYWLLIGGAVLAAAFGLFWPDPIAALTVGRPLLSEWRTELSPDAAAGVAASVRGTMVLIAGGLVALATLNETRARDERTRIRDKHANEAAERSHMLEAAESAATRYATAIAQLGNENAAVRMGGIYALERIAAASPEEIDTTTEVLCVFVRTRTVSVLKDDPGMPVSNDLQPPPPDVETALGVLRRMPHGTRGLDLHEANLNGVDLEGAILNGAVFSRARMYRTNLNGASLVGAQFSFADMPEMTAKGANLTDAVISESNFHDTSFQRADLTRAHLGNLLQTDLESVIGAPKSVIAEGPIHAKGGNLRGSVIRGQLSGSNFSGADLTGATLAGWLWMADFSGTDLRTTNLNDATFASQDNPDGPMMARYDEKTKWPDGYPIPDQAAGSPRVSDQITN